MERVQVRKLLQILLLIAIVAAAVRLIMVMRARHRPAATRSQPTKTLPLNREAYVVPKKLHMYDLKSARQLTQQPEWVKEGYRYTVYPYDPVRHRADFQHEAGLLLPLQKIEVEEVVTQPTPSGGGVQWRMPSDRGQRQILAIFKEGGKDYAVPVGTEHNGDYEFYADEMFFYEDPHELFNFWPAEVWKAIAEHRVENGMNEWQAAFAVGMAQPQPSSESDEVVRIYPNGGKPLKVTYRNGRAVEVRPPT